MRLQDRGDLLKRWSRNGFTVWLFQTGRRESTGQEILRYVFKDGRKTIFEGSDFGCSPARPIDSVGAVYDLLGFLSLGKGDTDSEYFKDYTKEQIEWRDSQRREELSIMVYDHEVRGSA
jgi:hypothetical protein